MQINTESPTIILEDAQDTIKFANLFAVSSPAVAWYYFSGEIGAGKTHLIRGFLQQLGVSDVIHSPSFSLVESYQVEAQVFHHFDCYRLHSPDELNAIGIRDYFSQDAIVLVEWPEKAQGVLPLPDVHFHLATANVGRTMQYEARTPRGSTIIRNVLNKIKASQ